jgi:hypothetical protein
MCMNWKRMGSLLGVAAQCFSRPSTDAARQILRCLELQPDGVDAHPGLANTLLPMNEPLKAQRYL